MLQKWTVYAPSCKVIFMMTEAWTTLKYPDPLLQILWYLKLFLCFQKERFIAAEGKQGQGHSFGAQAKIRTSLADIEA